MSARWFVVQTKPRQEHIALDNLERQGYHAYLPRLRLQKRRRDQWHSVLEPLFPGYLFVQLAPGKDNTAPIRSTLGVRGLVRFGLHTPEIDNNLIAFFRHQEQQQQNQPDSPDSLFKPGAPVTILNGPFAGLQAVYEMPKSTDRALLLISILGRQTQIQCELNNIVPA